MPLGTAHELLQAPLSQRTTPMLYDAVSSLYDLLRDCDAAPRDALGEGTVEDLFARRPTLQALADAGLLDLQALRPWLDELGELERPHRDGNGKGAAAQAVDRFLVAPVLLGLARLPVARAGTPPGEREPHWLDDAAAALLAVDAWRPLLSPDLAPDAVIEGPGCHTDPRLGRLLPAAHLLAGKLGYEAFVEAAAGQVPWPDAVDARTLDLAADLLRPEVRLDGPRHPLWQARPGEQDAAWLEDVIQALCVRRRREAGLPRAVPVVPEGGGFVLDLYACQLRAAQPRASLNRQVAEGWLDLALPWLPAPPSLCGRMARAGWRAVAVQLDHLDGLDDLIEVLLDLADQASAPQTVEGEGFRIEPATGDGEGDGQGDGRSDTAKAAVPV